MAFFLNEISDWHAGHPTDDVSNFFLADRPDCSDWAFVFALVKFSDSLAELLLYEADRAQHVAEVVRPALAAGRIVLSDRFYDATTAYQGYGRGLDLALVEQLNEWATGGLKPDLTLLFDLDVAVGLNRIFRAQSTAQPDRLDREPLAFHERVRRGYLSLAAREPHRFRLIPATGSIEETFNAALAAVESFLRG